MVKIGQKYVYVVIERPHHLGLAMNVKKDIPIPFYIEFHEPHRSSSKFGSPIRQFFTPRRELYMRYVVGG